MNGLRIPVQFGRNLLDKAGTPGVPPWRLGSAGALPGYKDPNGSDAAILLRDGRADAAHDMHQLFGPVVGGLVYQFTCCFKAAGRRWVSLGLWDDGAGQSGAQVWFDLDAGMVGTARLMGDGAARLQVSMTELGDGWFRCGLACQVSLSASTGMYTARIGLADADGNDTHAGDDESGVLVWAPSVQHRSSANLLSGGDAIGGKAWVLTNARARGAASGLPGDEASVLLREARKPGIHAVRQVVERCAPGLFLAFSCLAKPAGRGWIGLAIQDGPSPKTGLEAWFDLRRGTLGSARRVAADGPAAGSAIVPSAGGWYRCTLSGPWLPARAGAACVVRIVLGQGDGEAHYPGDDAWGVHLRGARLEAHARPR